MSTPPFPKNITIETTASCQLRCPACPTPVSLGRPRGFFSESLFQQLMEQVSWPLEAVSFGWSGEPLLNRSLPRMIAMAGVIGAVTYVSTNGLLLERDGDALLDSGLSVLRICLDGVDQGMAEKYRIGTDFDKVIQGTKRLVERRAARQLRTPSISLQMLVTRDTEAYLSDFLALAEACGVDEVYFKSFNLSLSDWLPSSHRQEMARTYLPVLPSSHRFLRYTLDRSGEYALLPEILAAPCPEIESGVTILHTGDVVPCCEDFRGSHRLGNIQQQSLEEIWRGAPYHALRMKVRGRALSMCEECSYPGSGGYNQVVPLRPVP
ncbi:MAG: SPASM domain-containing protein [Acidobacteriaceae bacterium]|nr:SPASM domain-containing protein [Acidobacteriaceae bacterium]